MEVVIGILVLIGLIAFGVVKGQMQLWINAAKELSLNMVSVYHLEGYVQNHKLSLLQTQNENMKYFSIVIHHPTNWPFSLYIFTKNPTGQFLKKKRNGKITKQLDQRFNASFTVLNGTLSDVVMKQILSLPRSNFFYMGSDEVRIVFYDTHPPPTNEIKENLSLLFQIVSEISEGKQKSKTIPKTNPSSQLHGSPFASSISTPKENTERLLLDENVRVSRNEKFAQTVSKSLPDESALFLKDNTLSDDSKPIVQFIPTTIVSENSVQNESTLNELYTNLVSFQSSSQSREKSLQEAKISHIQLNVEEVRNTFELGLPVSFRKGFTIKGKSGDVPILLYSDKESKNRFASVQRGHSISVEVRLYSWDFLQKRIVFLVHSSSV